MTSHDQEPGQATLFEWLDLLAVALARRAQRELTNQVAGVAMLVAATSKGTTGRGAYVDAGRLAIEIGKSERQVWRHFRTAVDLDWFEQTHVPKRPKAGEKGQRARYRLTLPALDLSLHMGANRVTSDGAETSHGEDQEAEPSDTFDTDRLTLSGEPSDTTQREDGTVTPSVGTPSVGTPSNSTRRPQVQDTRASDGDDAEGIRIGRRDPNAHAYVRPDNGTRCVICLRAESHKWHQVAA